MSRSRLAYLAASCVVVLAFIVLALTDRSRQAPEGVGGAGGDRVGSGRAEGTGVSSPPEEPGAATKEAPPGTSATAKGGERTSAPSGTTPQEKLAPPPWDDSAFAAFAGQGIAPPRTVFAAERPAEIDLTRIRDAIADARTVDPARFRDEAAGAESLDGDMPGPALAVGAAEPSSEEFEGPELMLRPQPVRSTAAPGAAAPAETPAPDPARVFEETDEDAPEATTFYGTQGVSAAKDGVTGEPAGAAETGSPRKLDARLLAPPRIGKILFQNEQGKYESLVPRALRIQAVVDGPRARTVVDYVVSNPHERRLEGTFYYPLPAGATPAAFGMYRATVRVEDGEFVGARLLPAPPPQLDAGLDEDETLRAFAPPRFSSAEAGTTLIRDWGELQLARVVSTARAREVYEEVVRRDIDPALLEWSGANTFQARVFPIEARAVKRVVLVYEQTLPLDGDLLRYTYPVPEEKELGAIDVRLFISESQGTLRTLVGRPGLPAPVVSGGWARYDLTLEPAQGQSLDVAIAATSPQAQVIEASDGRGLPGSVFFARLRPTLERRELQVPTGRALFLVDTSLSGASSGHGLSIELLQKILEADHTIDQYAVLLFDIRPRWVHAPSWRANDPASRKETIDELAKVWLEGATCFDATLRELDDQGAWLFEAGKPVHAFLLSDGFVTWGQDRSEMLLRRHPAVSSARWICYQIGTLPSNRDLFDALGRVSGGRTVTILSREELESGATAHRTAPAVLKQVMVVGAEGKDLVVAGSPRLLSAGQDLVIAGRIVSVAPSPELVVEGEMDGTPLLWRVPLRRKTGSALAARAWAELYTQQLLALDDERLDRMIVALSQRFRLANRVSSFLILDRDEDYEAFDLRKESVDLTELMSLRTSEEDQRRDRLQGIALDDVPDHVPGLVSLLQSRVGVDTRSLPPQPLLDRPLSGGDERLQAELSYRKARSEDELGASNYDRVARARALAGDTLGALRAYSCLVEQMPGNAEAARLAGYACMALGQYAPAAELFERVRLNRPFEPQSYLEEALALEADGQWGLAARNYEIVLSRDFRRHGKECRIVAAFHYARLLEGRRRAGGLEAQQEALLRQRLEELVPVAAADGEEPAPFSPVALQLTTHWNTSSTDIDLWVVEPEGERCFYGNQKTKGGGRLFWDITDGYGPELYQRRVAAPGAYEILVHYYGNNSARWTVPTMVLLVRDRRLFESEDEFTRQYRLRLLPAAEAALALGGEEF